MAKIQAGILSQVRGAVGGVVGGTWKGKNYLRQRVTPANPNTVAQQEKRGEFGKAVAFAKSILGPVLNTYVDPFQKYMSGFNWFIKQNKTKFTETPNYATLILTDGKLTPVTATGGGIAAGHAQVGYEGSLYPGLITAVDVQAVFYNTVTKEVAISTKVAGYDGSSDLTTVVGDHWEESPVYAWIITSKWEKGKLVEVGRSSGVLLD